MASNAHEWPLYFLPARQLPNGRYVAGHAWRAAARSTPFYLKTRVTLQDWKISLHGPDERYPNGPLFKYGPDKSFTPSEKDRGSVTTKWGDVTRDELRFQGERITPTARRVVRLRWSWELFQNGAHTEDASKRIGPKHQGAKILKAPDAPNALDVDFFLSEHKPYWPNKKEIERKDAGMGPLCNTAGQYLTAVVMHHSLIRHPSPEVGQKPFKLPTRISDRVRGASAVVHPDGYLFYEEVWMPREYIEALGAVRDKNAG